MASKFVMALKRTFKLPLTKEELIASIKRTGRTVDFCHRGWGNNISRCGDAFAVWSTPRLVIGDTILTEKGRFLVAKVDVCGDPPDMVFADFFQLSDEA